MHLAKELILLLFLCNIEWLCFSLSSKSPAKIASERTINDMGTDYGCSFCESKFPSRNALFRHLRVDPECSKLAGMDSGEETSPPVRQSWALQLQYLPQTDDSSDLKASESEMSCDRVTEALKATLETTCEGNILFVGCTQVSVARQRHETVGQENGAAASSDVFVATLDIPQLHLKEVGQLWDSLKIALAAKYESTLRIASVTQLTTALHTERACSQQVYHYLLPVTWLPDGDELQEWLLRDLKLQAREEGLSPHTNKFVTEQPNESLRKLRDALRTAECADAPNRKTRRKHLQNNLDERASKIAEQNARSDSTRVAVGRFGTLGQRERRPWHNFADPELMGKASPNQEPVWRVLDKARIVRYKSRIRTDDQEEEAVAIVEFRGDGFVRQQVRRIMGTALAMAHGWLPPDTIQRATSPSQFTWTPLAPAGRLYLADVRFHFDELKNRGKRLIPDADSSWVHERLLLALEDKAVREKEKEWLSELQSAQDKIALIDLDDQSTSSSLSDGEHQSGSPVPAPYNETIGLLRDIVESGQWPRTSKARSTVIMASEGDDSLQSGSFTVVNPNFRNSDKDNACGFPIPLANKLFPELARSVFELEASLSTEDERRCAKGDGSVSTLTDQARRPGSSHCAVNCNAQFTPHVDSGRGAGQSLSMIVGLGDYEGGDLGVEGSFHSIRYNPLEFDGWNLRHWTQPYNGERFSLVWFTPET